MIALVLLAQLAIVAHAPDTATTCAPFEVTVAARAHGVVPPSIVPPATTAAFQLLKSSIVSRVERDGAGQSSAITEATFVLATDASGRVALPSLMATVGPQHATATTLPIDVRAGGSLPPTVIVRAWLDRNGHVAPADTLYVGQQVDYVVDVQLNEAARQRLRRNPTFFPPEMPGVLAYDLAPPASLSRAGRHCFETLSYRRALFPLFAGPTTIAPAALTYSLPLSTSFFSREENFELRTDSVRFSAVDVPVDGRPADFGGAVGALAASSHLATRDARMGDPVVLTLRLEGTGNVKLWPRPALALDWASVANGDERVQVDTSLARVRGTKEFDWLLTPRKSGRQEIPAQQYPYFNADRREYAATRTAPLTLEVAAASLAVIDSAPTLRLSLRRALREERSEPATTRPWFWFLLAIAPVPATARRLLRKRIRRSRTRSPTKRLAQAAARGQSLSPREVRRLYLESVAERLPSLGGLTQRDAFARALRRGGVTEQTADDAAAMFDRLDAAAFSPTGALDAAAVKEVATLMRAIDAEAIRPAKAGTSSGLLVMLCLGVSATSLLAHPAGVEQTFAEGLQAYDRAAFSASAQLFSRVVSRVPNAEDAWVNLGTAEWAANDTAGAVRAWQRALRLDPLDGEARDRLDGAQAASLRSPGYVPPLPVDVLAFAALGCWLVGWLVLAIPPSRRPSSTRGIAGAALVIAVVCLAGAFEVRDRLDPRGLGVLTVSRLLFDAPGSQAAVASGTVGEIGQLGARDGEWVRIALDGSRGGWVPVASVLPLVD